MSSEFIINKVKPFKLNTMINISNEQLCLLYQQGINFAIEVLIEKNKKFIWSRAIKYSKCYNHKLDCEDLVQYGIIGFMEAAKRFDLKRKTKFITYATWWVDQQMCRGIIKYGFTVRIPQHYFDKVRGIIKIISDNPDSTIKEIIKMALSTGLDESKVNEILVIVRNMMSPASLNAYVGEDEDSELINFKIDDTTPSVEEQVEYNLLKESIEIVLNTLTLKERDIIEQRFGLRDDVDKTLEQLGNQYGLTRERIRQIEVKALKKLRHPNRAKKLKEFI